MLTSIHGVIASSSGEVGGVAWDVSTAVYDSKSKNIGTQDSNSRGKAFSVDGTKMYTAGALNGNVYQYTLSTAWDVSTASYASKLKDVSTEEAAPGDVALSDDGTKMYVVGGDAEVYQYTLSTAWDVSTASYASKLKDVSVEDTDPARMAFGDSGTKMYVIGVDVEVYQYTLSTAWDVSTASYASKLKDVSGEELFASALAFGDSGTKMYTAGSFNDTVYQYTLSTAWDVSTASYASKFKSVLSESVNPLDVEFSSDGTKMYVNGIVDNTVYQYSME